MLTLLLSALALALLVVMYVSLWSESSSDRAVQFRSTLDAALESRSLSFTTSTWTNYSPAALYDVNDVSRPVPVHVARFLP